MRRPLIALLSIAISFAPGMAAGAGSSTAAGRGAQLPFPSAALVATGSGSNLRVEAPGTRVEDALRAAIDPTDVRTQMDAVRLLIETQHRIDLPDLRPAHTNQGGAGGFRLLRTRSDALEEEPPPSDPDPDPEPAGTITFPSAAGDLSGDGLDDVLALDIKLPQETVEIRALRGTDGDQLWKRRLDEAADVAVMPASDLTGDGIEDLILLGLDVLEETSLFDCPEEEPQDHCRVDYEANYTWLTGVLDGSDGKLRWSERYPASQEFHFLFDSQDDVATSEATSEESLRSSNLILWPYLSGDHTRDGFDDLVLESVDLNYDIDSESRRTVVVDQDEGTFEVDSATRALVIRGSDGDTIFSRSSVRGPTIATLEPVGDLVGDPAPDLLWQETAYTNDTYACVSVGDVGHCSDEPDLTVRFATAAIDGTTLNVAWRNEASGLDDVYGFPLDTDVSGDGVDDLAQLTYAEEGVNTTRVMSGADGTQLWSRAQPSDAFDPEFPTAFGQLGGGTSNDVVLTSFIEKTDALTGATDYGIRITRVDGATGQSLFESERSLWVEPEDPPEDTAALFIYRYVGFPEDADADGVDDVYMGGIGEVLVDNGSEWLVPVETDSRAIVESSRGPSVLLQRETQDPMVFESTPDLDGDAHADVFEWHFPADPFADDPRFDVFARPAAPGEPLWSRSFVGDEFWLGTLWAGGDHDGQPGQELLYGDNSKQTGTWRSLVGSLRGADGTARWVKGGDE